MGVAFADERHRAGARVIVGILATAPPTPGETELAAHDLGASDLTSTQVAAGAAILIDRILTDVAAVMRLDRDETLGHVGRWVAADEFAASG